MKIIQWKGKPIAFPGVYAGVPMDWYHSADCCIEPSISSGGLRTIFNKSPKHYWDKSPYNPNRAEDEESDALLLGRATHHLLLGEDDFKSQFAIRPDTLAGEKFHAARSACKVWLQDRADEGRNVITQAMAEQIKGMARELAKEPLIQHGILNGQIERSFIWKDKQTGVWLKARPDALPNDSLDFCDLKSCPSVEDDDLQRDIAKFGYYQQAGLVAEGCRELLGKPLNTFSLIFVEKKRPHDIAIVTLKENEIDRGMRANRVALCKFAECLASNNWPGKTGGRADAAYSEMRPFDQARIDDRIKNGI